MSDLIKRISDAKEMIEKKPNQSTVDYTIYGVLTDCDIVLKSQQAEIERLCKKIGVMKESIEDAIMSETVFDTFDDLSSYVNAERCRSEDWTGGIRDAIQAVRAWGE